MSGMTEVKLTQMLLHYRFQLEASTEIFILSVKDYITLSHQASASCGCDA